jgi:hypothetical protein
VKCALAQIPNVFREATSCFGARQKQFEWIGEAGSGRGGGPVIHYKQKENRDSTFKNLTETFTHSFVNLGSLSMRLHGRFWNPDVERRC